MAMCASCQCYVLNDVPLPEMGDDEEGCSQKRFMSNQTVDWMSNSNHRKEGLELELAGKKASH
jgi:2Fe-2S ferredoxin